MLLSSGGLGYYEYAAEIDGDATVELTVPLDQVDDVLKSLSNTTTRAESAGSTCRAASRSPRPSARCPSPPTISIRPPASLRRYAARRSRSAALVRFAAASSRSSRRSGLRRGAAARAAPSRGGLERQGARAGVLKEVDSIEFVDPSLRAESTRR